MQQKLLLRERASTQEPYELREEIRAGLLQPQKTLPAQLFYDERGSELFDEITKLPEYYLTRAEQALLREHVPDWIARLAPRSVVELGSGSAIKTRIILDAIRARGGCAVYVPLDISAGFLDRSVAALRRDYPEMSIVPIAADFTRSLVLPPALPRPALFTFLGSTIGNFTFPSAVDILRRVHVLMLPGDRFILGVDLRKDRVALETAYNDSRGVTAAFNINMLHVLNRRFGADFDVDAFCHRAIYNELEHRIEMHLVSTKRQRVHISKVGDFDFDAGETILTEISCKYDPQTVAKLFAAAGLELVEWRGTPAFALGVGRASLS